MQGLRPGTSPPPVSTPMRVIGQASREECRSSVGFGARARSPGRGARAAGARQQLEVPQPREGVAAGGVAGASHLLDVGTLPAVAGDAREVHDRSLSVMALGVSGRTRTSGGACIAQHYRVPRVSVIFARIRS